MIDIDAPLQVHKGRTGLVFKDAVFFTKQPFLLCLYGFFEASGLTHHVSYPPVILRIGPVNWVSQQRNEVCLRNNLRHSLGNKRVVQVPWGSFSGDGSASIL